MDEPRLLHRQSEHGYTRVAVLALTLEPEAVGEDDQRELTARARQNAADRRRHELQRVLEDTRRRAEWHAAQLRHHEREIRRLERRLAI